MTDVLLKEFTKDDFNQFFDLISDEDVKKAGLPENISEELAKKIFEKILNDNWNKKISDDENNLLGIILFNDRGQDESLVNTKELGFAVDSKFRQQGIATKAVELAINFAQENQLKELWASILSRNIASQKVLEKNGFQYKYETDMSILGLENQKYYLRQLND